MERMDNRMLNSVGSSRIRARWLLNYWPEAEEYLIGKDYDVLFFQKVYWGSMMRNFKGIKILDLCFAGDTLILTNKGWKEIRDVRIGDKVVTHKGRLKKVIKKMVRTSETYKVKAGYLPEITVTPNHPFMSNFIHTDGYGKREFGEWDWKRVDKLDELRRHGDGSIAASLVDRKYKEYEIDSEIAWLLGYYLAEGSCNKNGVSFAMGTHEDLHKNRAIEIIKNMGKRPRSYDREDELGESRTVVFSSREWSRFLRREFGARSSKRIPDFIYNLSKKNKIEFISGYLSGDGYLMDKGGITSNSISKYISYGIWQLYKDCGILGQISYKKREGKAYRMMGSNGKEYISKPQWVVRLNPSESIKFISLNGTILKDCFDWEEPKSDNVEVKKVGEYYAHPIRSIKKNGILPVYNITIEDDHSYIAGGLVVANCDPDWLEGSPVFEFIDLCDAITTSTEVLAEYVRKLRPKAFVQCVPDRIYIPEHKPIKTKHVGPLKKLCWFGYHQNTHYLMSTFDELIKRGLELTIIATAVYDPPLAYRDRLRLKNVPWDYGLLFKEIVKHDAVLMPVPSGDERAKYKSNNKITQSWAQGMPVVSLPEDIDRFMDPKEREKESKKRLKEIREKWDVRFSVDQYRDIIRKIKENMRKLRQVG